MPSTPLYPPVMQETTSPTSQLPQLLQTPLGIAILEIQGSLNFSQQASGLDTVQPIGRVVFPLVPAGTIPAPDDTKWMKKVQLFVGANQKLTGEVRKLAKPLAVIRRRENDSSDEVRKLAKSLAVVRRREDDGGDDAIAGQSQRDELEIVDVVRYKLYFGHRPEFV